jgi:hypothetical protein
MTKSSRKRMTTARSEAGVEAAVCSGAEDDSKARESAMSKIC